MQEAGGENVPQTRVKDWQMAARSTALQLNKVQ